MFYKVTYKKNGYQIADAFRPNPGWGERVFRVNESELPKHTDAEIVHAARLDAPVGYWLQRVIAIGGDPHERELFFKPLVTLKPAAAQRA